MTSSRRACLALVAACLWRTSVGAALQCAALAVDGQNFDLTPLGGVHTAASDSPSTPTTVRTTYAISLCDPLPINGDLPDYDQCAPGSSVCVTETNIKTNEPDRITRVVSYAADAFASASFGDAVDGVAARPLLLSYGADANTRATLRLICDPNAPNPAPFTVSCWANGQLNVDWRASSACARPAGGAPETPNTPDGEKASSGTGVFGMFLWLLFFGFLLYLGVGAWVQYTTYGARGWDLLPHRDVWRDLPYVIKDALTPSRSSRAGYSSLG